MADTMTPANHSAAEHGHDHGHGHHDLEAMKTLGFWFFLSTDLVIFALLFASYIVLRTHTNGGPAGKDIFEVPGFMWETFILLTSSFTSGLATLAMRNGSKKGLIGWLIITALLGAAFIGLEVNEFVKYIGEGNGMSRSAFLTAFFTLVGTHGCHVSAGLIWMIGLMFQVKRRGITAVTTRKIMNLSLYWHFLDVVWVFLFTVVYLNGMVMK